MRRIILALCVWSGAHCGFARAESAAVAQLQPESSAPAPDVPRDAPPLPSVAPPRAYGEQPARLSVERELVRVDLELARLRSQRPSVVHPILLVAAGYTFAVVTGLISVAVWGDAREHSYRWSEQGDRYKHVSVDEDLRGPIRATACLMALGLAAGSAGVMLLVPRVRERRALRRAMRPLQERRHQLVRQLSWTMSAGRDALGWSASVRF